MTNDPIAILGGGPVGLTLALLLARCHVPSIVVDARALEDAKRDRRLLALSRGTLDTLAAVVTLPPSALAPIRSVVISSRGEFGRAVLDEAEMGGRSLGATVRYGELLTALAAGCAAQPLVQSRRPCVTTAIRQRPTAVDVQLGDGSALVAPLAVNAEGIGAGRELPARQAGLIADVEVEGPAPGAAFERFTRDGPLALLPLPGPAGSAVRRMSLVWCMPAGVADRREALPDDMLLAELQSELGARNGKVRSIAGRGRYPLVEQARDSVHEHRLVHVGNAAQTLHPVAGQGLNLGVRDCVALADLIATAAAAGADPASRLGDYERARRADRVAIRTLTRTMPAFFASRFVPFGAARSLGLTLLSAVPDLRVEFARFLMFGVRS